jgi:hypothetical protein
MKGIEERIRKSIGEEMRKLGSKSFYVRTRSLEGRGLRVKIWMEREALDLMVISRDKLAEVRKIIRRLEKELGVRIEEEFKPL